VTASAAIRPISVSVSDLITEGARALGHQ
jgi:hypothetical protein